ncbi:MAG: hypothetical protein GXX96_18700, partial [Planctomycetaceae bacterium]|nr:hypothetical protein [Planctomycetaceae bacterium]
MVRRLAFLFGGLTLLFAPTAHAQEAMFGQLYGLGVHAYFSYDYQGAYEHLTKAIDAGSQDPRAYYFRGLCYLQLGREDEAQADFEKGAEFEAKEGAANYEVPRALVRIQGEPRMLLEEHRRDARAKALEREMQRRRQMYGEMRAQQSAILKREIEAAPAVPAGTPAPAAGSNQDPFGVGAAPAGAETPAAAPSTEAPAAAETPAEPSAPAPSADPFATPAAAPAPSSDPFATPGAAAPEPAMPEPAAPAPATDPFATPAPATPEPAVPAPAADPFATPAPATPEPAAPAMPEEPAAPEPAAAAPAADPFAAPAPAAAATEAPAPATPEAPAAPEPAAPA